MEKKDNIIVDKVAAFNTRIIAMVNYLKVDNSGAQFRSMIDQIFRCGTSIGANVSEALFAQSRPDFISKMSIALKEANETKHWLDTLYISSCLTSKQHTSMMNDINEIISILVKIVKTAKENELKAAQVKQSLKQS